MAGNAQANIHVRCHRDGLRSNQGPSCSIGRTVAGERIPAAHHLHPVGGRQTGSVYVATAAASAGSVLERHSISGGYEGGDMPRISIKGLANHHARFRPRIGALDAYYSRHRAAIAAGRLIHSAERIRRARNVSSRTIDRERGAGITGPTGGGFAAEDRKNVVYEETGVEG